MHILKKYYNRFTFRVRRLIEWFPIIWNDSDYDFYFLLKAMSFKVSLMREYFEHTATEYADVNEELKQLKLAEELLKRLVKDKYFLEEHTSLVKEALIILTDNLGEEETEKVKLAITRHIGKKSDDFHLDLVLLTRLFERFLCHWWS